MSSVLVPVLVPVPVPVPVPVLAVLALQCRKVFVGMDSKAV